MKRVNHKGSKTQRSQSFIFGVCFIFLILGGCKKEEGRVLARVGKKVITEEEFYNLIPPQYVGMLTKNQKKELLKRWIDTELIYQESVSEGIHKEPNVKRVLEEMEREMVANEFLERYISKLGNVDEHKVKEYFNLHREEYNTERQSAQIVVQDKAQIQEILEKLKGGELFSRLAREYSIDQSAKNSGVMGYIRRGDMPQLPEFEDALFLLEKIGDISEPVETNYGYHIIKLLGIRNLAREVKYEDVQREIMVFLNLTERKRAVSEFLTELREKKEIEENYNLLE